MKINEIFYSIEGEGKRTGQPCVFIRRSGCNLHCLYDGKDCDTPYRDEGTEMTVSQIMDVVEGFGCKNITLTGGEPLLPNPDLYNLRKRLYEEGYLVNIETNGTMSTEKRFETEFFTVDYKCGCSGMTKYMDLSAFVYLNAQDVIKFVVSEDDFEQVRTVVEDFGDKGILRKYGPMIYVSPCFGRCDLQKLVEFVKELYKIYPKVSVNLQIHKIIWSPDQRGV